MHFNKVFQDNDPLRNDIAFLTIRVLDVNDNLPEFLSPPETAIIDENSRRGTYVCRIFAADQDAVKIRLYNVLIWKTNFATVERLAAV